MERDGQRLNYRDWMADDAMREALATPGVMPKYFKALMEGEEEPEEGTGVIGYRIVYHAPDGKLYQPFFARLNSPELILGIDSQNSGQPGLFGRAAYSYKDRVNANDVGYYYFPDREIAEDYMKAIVYKGVERAKFQSGLGAYELYRVRGIAGKNVRGDEGFVMNEMMYDATPLVSVPVDEPFNTFLGLTGLRK